MDPKIYLAKFSIVSLQTGIYFQEGMFREECSGRNVQGRMFRKECSGKNVQERMFRKKRSGKNV
ncbi:MAG: hypothetical protein PHF18_10410 [Methanosarcina sp.]|nr:hypothetical protein [Methanosarcina sp.]